MNINRHNYESFFMLYIDKELSGVEMQAVVEFVNKNPDLKAELEQLELAVLPDEDFSFINKDSLYKKETISAAAETDLLLLLDAELSFEKAAELKNQLGSNKILATEWELLQQTKLISVADEFIFENKEILYRKEEKARPVFYMLRWAAAAVVIGIGFYTGLQLLQKEENGLTPVIANVKTDENNLNPVNNSKDTLSKVEIINSLNTNSQSEKKKQILTSTEDQIATSKNVNSTDNKSENFKTIPQKSKAQNFEKNAVLLASNNENLKIKNYDVVDFDPEVNAKLPAKRPAIIDINILEDQQNKNVIRTAFNGNNDADRILYMDKEAVEKTKVGKFLKKIKNGLSGDIEIKTEKTLKIAGFEFALK